MALKFKIPKVQRELSREEIANDWIIPAGEEVIGSLYKNPDSFETEKDKLSSGLKQIEETGRNLLSLTLEDKAWLDNVHNLSQKLSYSNPLSCCEGENPSTKRFIYAMTIATAIDQIRFGRNIHEEDSKINHDKIDSSIKWVLHLQYH